MKAIFGEKQKPTSDKTPSIKPKTTGFVNDTTPATSEQSVISGYSPEFFFKLAHCAKEENKLESWERHLIFNLGTYLVRGWRISDKMESQAVRILQIAKQLSLVEAAQRELENDKGTQHGKGN